MSRRLFDRLYAMIGRSLNMWASLSFDWRKCQFLFATSAIYEVRGLYVVTKAFYAVGGVPLSRPQTLVLCQWQNFAHFR